MRMAHGREYRERRITPPFPYLKEKEFTMKKLIFMVLLLFMIHIPANAEINTLDIDNSSGDYTFFNSHYIKDYGDTYRNFGSTAKTNKITINRYSPERENDYIILEKNTDSDCHVDVTAVKQFRYVVFSGDFMIKTPGTNIHLCYMRDSKTKSGTNYDSNVLMINPDLKLVTGSSEIVGSVEKDTWFNISVQIDVENHTADIYMDGKLIKVGLKINNAIKYVSMIRVWINTGANGDLYVDNLDFTGTKYPPDGTMHSIFYGNGEIERYLSDKTAFHIYSGAVFANGKKTYTGKKGRIKNGISYVKLSVYKDALGMPKEGVTSDGYVDIAKAAAYSGNYVFDDGNGLVIVSDYFCGLTTTGETPEFKKADKILPDTKVEAVNKYMFYMRESAEQIEQRFDALSRGVHPRIMARAEDFERIRNFKETAAVMMRNRFISLADGYCDLEPVKYEVADGMRLLPVSREMLSRMTYLGFAYQMTGDEKYAEAAWKNLKSAGEFPDWNTSHMLDTGEMCTAFGIGYDWMYNAFTEEQRNFIAETVIRMGISPTRLAYYGRLPGGGKARYSAEFAKWKSNFNTVINGGVIVAALAVAEHDRDLCFDTVEKAARSLEYTMQGFDPDGSWIEGPNYWGYTMQYLARAIESFKSVLGTDYGFINYRGFDKTAMFERSLESAQGMNSFHDSWNGHLSSSAFRWLGNIFNKDVYHTVRYNQHGTGALHRTGVSDLLWYKEGVTVTEDQGLPHDWITRGIESFSTRQSYQAVSLIYASAHGGLVTCYHSQKDAGTFVFDILDRRWAEELDPEDYDIAGKYNFDDIYRRRTEGQNCVVINPDKSGGQENDGFVPIIKYDTFSGGMNIAYNMTSAYKSNVNSYVRGFAVGDNYRSFTVRDEIHLKKESEVYWFMHTKANATVDGNTVTLERDGKKINMEFGINAEEYEIGVMDAVPLDTSPNPSDQTPNTGYKKIYAKIKASGALNIEVKLASQNIKTGLSEKPVSEWSSSLETDIVRYNMSNLAVNKKTDKIEFGNYSGNAVGVMMYDTASGKFGREATDKSAYLHNTGEAFSGEAYQFLNIPFGEAGKTAAGESIKLDLHFAVDKNITRTVIDGISTADGKPVKQGEMVAIRPDGTVEVMGKILGKINLIPQKWYRLTLLIKADEENTYSLYIDNKFVADGVFTPKNLWNTSQQIKIFGGLTNIWVGHRFSDAPKNSGGGYENTELYIDDVTLQKYVGEYSPNVPKIGISGDDILISENAGLTVFAPSGTDISDVSGAKVRSGKYLYFPTEDIYVPVVTETSDGTIGCYPHYFAADVKSGKINILCTDGGTHAAEHNGRIVIKEFDGKTKIYAGGVLAETLETGEIKNVSYENAENISVFSGITCIPYEFYVENRKIKTYADNENAVMYVCRYENGKLAEVKTAALQNRKFSADFSGKEKCFVFERESLKPLCDVFEIK